MARVPSAGCTVTWYPAFLRTSAQMFETMACSSKLVDPITMVGLLEDAPAGAPVMAAGTISAEARAVSAPKASDRGKRMGTPFRWWLDRAAVASDGTVTGL